MYETFMEWFLELPWRLLAVLGMILTIALVVVGAPEHYIVLAVLFDIAAWGMAQYNTG